MPLSDDDLAHLATVPVTVAPGRTVDVVTLIAAWRSHVARLEAGRLTAPDHIAALCFRDWIAQAAALLPEDLRRRLDQTVAATDRRFLSGTVPDVDGLVEQAIDDPDSMRDWWWHRLPRTGPVHAELTAQAR